MNKIKHRAGTLRTGFIYSLLLAMVLLSLPASAVPQIDGLDNDQVLVRELMRLEADHALQLARERSAGVSFSVTTPPRRTVRSMSGQPRLVAIYGVGQQLLAEVALDQVIYLYRRGQALPVGVAPGDDIYLLEKISTSCVTLKNGDASHHLCLQPAQWVGK